MFQFVTSVFPILASRITMVTNRKRDLNRSNSGIRVFIMSLRVADLLKLPSFSKAAILKGTKQTGRFVRTVSTDYGILDAGVVYAVEQNCIDLDVFIKNHPGAAGFLVPSSCTYCGKSSLPVIAVPDIARCISEYQNCEKGISPAAELYSELEKTATDLSGAMKVLSRRIGSEVYLINEKKVLIAGSRKITKKALTELLKDPSVLCLKVWAENEWSTLICEGEANTDTYLLSCAAQALTGWFARNSRVSTAAKTGIGHLIYNGETELALLVADQCRLDIPKTANVWLLYGDEGTDAKPWRASIREFCRSFGTVYLLAAIGSDLLLVMEKNCRYHSELQHMEALSEYCQKSSIPLTLISGLTLSGRGASIHQLRQSLFRNDDLEQLFPEKGFYTVTDICFAKDCRRIILQGSDELYRYRSIIQTLKEATDAEMVKTLAVYYIDEAMSVTETADKLFLHRNTVKYRLQKAEDILEMNLSCAIGIRELVTALGIDRLMG